MNKYLKYIIALHVICFNACDLINPPKEEKEPEGEQINHKNLRLIPDDDITDVIDDTTYSLKVNSKGDAELKLKAVYKYDYAGYYEWRTASETGFATLKSNRIYSYNENTLYVKSIENSSFIIAMVGIHKNETIYISYIYLKAERS